MPPMNRSKILDPAEASASRLALRNNHPIARRNRSFGPSVLSLRRANRKVRILESPAVHWADLSRDSIPSLPERLVTHDEIERTANVGFECSARSNGIASRQCIEHF